MGSGKFDARAYASFSATTAGKTTDEIYTARTLDPYLEPKGVKVRESRDSLDNPQSTPIIVGIDVTGSMGMIADTLARQGLGTLFTGILDRKPVTDPHVMFMAIGDANCDSAPLQVSQFEADKRIIEQLTKIYIEHGGGGNCFESYNLPWYFAAHHTLHDSMEKRGKRGYLFTVGDEEAPRDLTKQQIAHFIGDTPEKDINTKELLDLVRRSYDVFHVIVEEGDYASRHMDAVNKSWVNLLGQRVIRLADHQKLAETIVAAIQMAEGANALDAANWGGHLDTTVHKAIESIQPGKGPKMIGHAA